MSTKENSVIEDYKDIYNEILRVLVSEREDKPKIKRRDFRRLKSMSEKEIEEEISYQYYSGAIDALQLLKSLTIRLLDKECKGETLDESNENYIQGRQIDKEVS